MNDFTRKEKENMREILFRGKRVDNGEWVEGLLARYNPKFPSANILDEFEILTPVKTITVGQYTGLKDKNGKKIFDGDILESQIGDKNIWYVCFEDGAFVIHMVNSYQLSAYQRKRTCLQNYCCSDDIALYDLKLIGNIHDNPELLNNN